MTRFRGILGSKGTRIVLKAASGFVSFLAFAEYVFVWRKDLEASTGPWVLGLLEGIMIGILAVITIWALLSQKGEIRKVKEYLV